MRIVYVLTTLAVGGAERQVIALARRMRSRGHEVAFLVLFPRGEGDLHPGAGIEVFHLGMKRRLSFLLAGIWKGAVILRRLRPDLLHSHTCPANLVSRLLRLAVPKARLIATIHNIYEGGGWRMLGYRVTDFLCQQTTAVSTAAWRRFLSLRAIRREKSRVVTNAIDLDEFRPNGERRTRMRRLMRVEGAFVWLAAGRIAAAKDYPNLMHAFALLAGDHEAELWIAGRGVGALQIELEALCAAEGISKRVRWLGQREDLVALFDAADGFVLSSAWEGMPLVVAEAMAMQLPVVATNVGGVEELTADLAWLVPAGDSAELAAAMLGLMALPAAERCEMGRRGRERMMHSFEIEGKAKEWEQLYGICVANKLAG